MKDFDDLVEAVAKRVLAAANKDAATRAAHTLALARPDLSVERCRALIADAEAEREILLRRERERESKQWPITALSAAEAMRRAMAAERTSEPCIYTDAHRVRDYLETLKRSINIPGNVMAAATRLAQREDSRQ